MSEQDQHEPKPFSVDTLEAEIREIAAQPSISYAPRRPTALPIAVAALPDYVQHDPATPEIGKLTAESVVRDFEETAKELEAMRGELMDAIGAHEALIRDMLSVNDLIRTTAQDARAQGQLAFQRIQAQAKLTASIRDQVTEIGSKLRGE